MATSDDILNGDFYTWAFKSIFSSYDDFKTWIDEVGLTDEISEDSYKYIFNVLYREYHNANINYDNIDDFKLDLINYLLEYSKRIEKDKELIDSIYKLTNDELIALGNTIHNESVNDNSYLDDVNKPLAFVSMQTYQSMNDGKLKGYLTALNNMPSANIKAITSWFRPLFISIMNLEEFLYV